MISSQRPKSTAKLPPERNIPKRNAKQKTTRTKRKDTVQIIGAGKVGVGLRNALRKAGYTVALRAARKGLPSKAFTATFIILAVRDRELEPLAQALAEKRGVSRQSICVHVAGSLGTQPLSALRAVCSGIAQMHPMIPFASLSYTPSLKGGNLHIVGDAPAVARAFALGKAIGMRPRTVAKLDPVLYHAAAGLVANGAAALAAMGERLLRLANVPEIDARNMLGPLIRGVGDNVEHLGFPQALTGPIRRGDPKGVAKHLALLVATLPHAVPLYCAAGLAQLPLAKRLKEAPNEAFSEIEALLLTTLSSASSVQ
jgi:predicted short-subunit dehydrogenase-like oxidoreductase (DUF2520 family)